MPSFNQGEFINQAIESILSQDYPNKELIVIDGGSTDSTVAVLRSWEDKLAYWVSEPDNGQADAIVKGLKRSRGEIFNWINSDDVLIDGALSLVAAHLGNAGAVAGPVINFRDGESEVLRANRGLSAEGLIKLGSAAQYHQPGIWLRGDVLRSEVSELIPTQLHYVFDWALYTRYFLRHPKVAYIDSPLARFRLHDESKTVKFGADFERERVHVLEEMKSEEEFSALRDTIENRIRRTKFKLRLREIEQDVGPNPGEVTSADLARLIRLHPPSALKARGAKRIATVAGRLMGRAFRKTPVG